METNNLFKNALEYYYSDNYNAAIKIFKNIIKTTNNQNTIFMKNICYEELGKHDKMHIDNKEFKDYEIYKATIFYNKADRLFTNKLYDKAITYCDKIINMFPYKVETYNLKGLSQIKLKDYTNASVSFSNSILIYKNREINGIEMLKGDKSYSYSNFYEGLCLYELGRLKESLEYFEEAINSYEGCTGAYYYKGLCLKDINKYKEAIKYFNKTIELNPNYDDAYYNKCICLEKLGKSNNIRYDISTKSNDLKYHKSLVIFIDILGTKDNDSFDSLFKVNKLFRKLTKEQEEQDNKEHNLHRIYKRTIFSFSDCAYIIYDYKDEVDNFRKNYIELSFVALYNTLDMLDRLISEGYIFRGGITFGDVYYVKNENIVFGPAIAEAYELESKYAKNPRVLIQDNFARKILKLNNISNKNLLRHKKFLVKKGIPEYALLDNGEIIKQDIDDKKYYLNYLNRFDTSNYRNIILDSNGIRELTIDNIVDIIIKKMEKFYSENNFKVLGKYIWLYKYCHNLKCSENFILDIESFLSQYYMDFKSDYYYIGSDCINNSINEYIIKLNKLNEWFSSYKEYIENTNNIEIIFNSDEYKFLINKTDNIAEYIKKLINYEMGNNK